MIVLMTYVAFDDDVIELIQGRKTSRILFQQLLMAGKSIKSVEKKS